MPILEVKNLKVYFRVVKGTVKAVDGVSFSVDRGETLGLVGESGCGKTTTAFAIMRLLPSNGMIVGGEIIFKDNVIGGADISILELAKVTLQEKEDWYSQLQEILNEEKKKIESEKEKLKTVGEEISRLNSQIREKKIELKKLTEKLKTVGEEISRLNSQIREKKIELRELDRRKRELKSEINFLRDEIRKHKESSGILKTREKITTKLSKMIKEKAPTSDKEMEKLKLKITKYVARVERGRKYNSARKKILRQYEKDMNKIRWKEISIIFQSAMNALNPVYRVGDQIAEALILHEKMTKKEALERVKELFKFVGLDPSRIIGYPHEFSGGMRQRAMIAMALACNPSLIIADEPTTALDVIMQDKILGEIVRILKKLDLSMIIISHDISVVAEVSDKIAIMYAGKIVEYGNTVQIFKIPSNPYTIGLMGAFPSIKGEKKRLEAIPGSPPDLVSPPSGCRFHPRCKYAHEICRTKEPPTTEVEKDHYVMCHFANEMFQEQRKKLSAP